MVLLLPWLLHCCLFASASALSSPSARLGLAPVTAEARLSKDSVHGRRLWPRLFKGRSRSLHQKCTEHLQES